MEEFVPLLSPDPTQRRERAGTVCLLKLQCVFKICPPKTLINSISLWSLSPKTLLPSGKNPLSLNVIERLPAGVIFELYKKLSEISGIEIEDGKLKDF